jgi:hypothetical protein
MIRSRIIAIAALVTLSSTARADDTSDVVGRLGQAANCKDKASPLRAWCPAASWAKGKTGALKPGVMAG